MIKIRLYEYDSSKEENGYRGKDYSANLMLGETITDDLSEVMGTAELTLAGLSFSEEFSPKTKFIIDAIDTSMNEQEPVLTWHVEVQEDVVSMPILSDSNYYDHHITFTEAGVDAQGRLVDNIAVTYKLQDVTLDGETVIDTSQLVKPEFNAVTGKPISEGALQWDLFEVDNEENARIMIGKKLQWKFADWFSQDSPYYGNSAEWNNFHYYQGVPLGETLPINLPVPMLEILEGVDQHNYFTHLGYCSIVTKVTELDLKTNNKTTILNFTTNPAPSSVVPQEKWEDDWVSRIFTGSSTEGSGAIVEKINFSWIFGRWWFDMTPSGIRLANFSNPTQNTRRIMFNAKPNCKYTITVNLMQNFIYSYNLLGEAWIVGNSIGQPQTKSTNNQNVCAKMEFMTYQVGDESRIMLKEAPEQNAFVLFQKAQLNTQNVIKQEGTPITDTTQAYYVGDVIAGGNRTDAQLALQNTTIVENFYNQKNWWEMLIEIGKYIHAIPKVEFGEDNRYVVNWHKLGQTNQLEDNSTKISIFNSKSVENFVSACSSYITNMVQLGGIIDEWVAPKSSSEDYLVYNDVAEIHTSKPIIEIVSMEAKCINNFSTYGIDTNDAVRSLTPPNDNYYVFEQNVYNILSINGDQRVNKGKAIYYELGANKIKGLTYRLPTVSSGDIGNDYAIKNILGMLFNMSTSQREKVRANDFQFHIIYRTKDTARSDQTRPDLRKYLLASKYDRVPQHYQFNNQTDVVVDSTKFGNNIYGKLIRTGNSNYTVTEWNDSLLTVKQVGDLYNIRGELYYVSTVKNTFYGTHIVSEITFSKDYNQLSEIIGIPSEPRFYEISEQSLIEREVPLNDYIVLGTSVESEQNPLSFVRDKGWAYIDDLLFKNEINFPKYAITIYKNDLDKIGDNIIGNGSFYKDVCHPISTYSIQNTLTLEWDMVDNFSAGDRVEKTSHNPDGNDNTAYRTLEPVQYTDPHGRSDLVDFMVMRDLGNLNKDQIFMLPDSPYRTRFPEYTTYIGYWTGSAKPTDIELNNFVNTQKERLPQQGDGIIAEVTVLDTKSYYFYFYTDNEWVENAIQSYNAEEFTKAYIGEQSDKYLFGNELMSTLGDNLHGLGLMKDNREAIHFNYNLQMLTDSDRFVLSSWLWQPNKGTLRLALLNQEINKISNETISQDNVIDDSRIIYSEDPLTAATMVDEANGTITIPISTLLEGADLTDVKAIAIISDTIVADDASSGARYFVMGRNIGGLDTSDITDTLTPEQAKEKAKADWYISNYDKSMFPHQ